MKLDWGEGNPRVACASPCASPPGGLELEVWTQQLSMLPPSSPQRPQVFTIYSAKLRLLSPHRLRSLVILPPG